MAGGRIQAEEPGENYEKGSGVLNDDRVRFSIHDHASYRQTQAPMVIEVEKLRDKKSVDEIASAWKIPPKYVGYATPAAARLKSNVVILSELK
jgi:hypothetical protein